MSTNPTSQENAEPIVILKRETENAFSLKFHESELLVLPAQGGDNFTSDEQAALQIIVQAVNSRASDQRRIKELETALETFVNNAILHNYDGTEMVATARTLLSQGAPK